VIEFLDTNVLINLIRKNLPLPAYAAISVVVAGELKAFAVKRQWGYQKRLALEKILGEMPISVLNSVSLMSMLLSMRTVRIS